MMIVSDVGGYVAFPANVEENQVNQYLCRLSRSKPYPLLCSQETGEVTKYLDDPNLLQNRPAWQRLIVISAGVVANFLLTFLISTGVASTSGLGQPVFENAIIVASTPDTTSAGYTGGLRTNDMIVAINQKPIINANERTKDEFVEFIRERADVPVQLDIIREKKPMRVTVTPKPIGLNSKGVLGVGIASRVDHVNRLIAKNPIEALKLGFDETYRITDTTISGLKSFVSSGFVAGGDVGGPIAVVKAGAQIAELSPTALLGFMAALSINLAVLNSLPVPGLDGGQFVFAFVELITRGGKLPKNVQESITAVAFGLLLLFSASTLAADISHINEPVPGIGSRLPITSSTINDNE
jgi:membrane-associated protease RseP (regulator of RpoE activity)